MRAYETIRFEEFPDIGDIKSEGRASHVGRYAEPGGDFKPYTRKSQIRRAVRRYLKRADRARQVRHERLSGMYDVN